MENNVLAAAQGDASIYNVPVGAVMPYMGPEGGLSALQNDGWLICHGASKPVAEFPRLYAAIGNTCGGDATNFNLPDLRGMFLRGADVGSKRDPDVASRTPQGNGRPDPNKVGSRQADEYISHYHTGDVFVPNTFAMRIGSHDWHPPHDIGRYTNEAGSSETRPKNVYVYYLIFAGPAGAR